MNQNLYDGLGQATEMQKFRVRLFKQNLNRISLKKHDGLRLNDSGSQHDTTTSARLKERQDTSKSTTATAYNFSRKLGLEQSVNGTFNRSQQQQQGEDQDRTYSHGEITFDKFGSIISTGQAQGRNLNEASPASAAYEARLKSRLEQSSGQHGPILKLPTGDFSVKTPTMDEQRTNTTAPIRILNVMTPQSTGAESGVT